MFPQIEGAMKRLMGRFKHPPVLFVGGEITMKREHDRETLRRVVWTALERTAGTLLFDCPDDERLFRSACNANVPCYTLTHTAQLRGDYRNSVVSGFTFMSYVAVPLLEAVAVSSQWVLTMVLQQTKAEKVLLIEKNIDEADGPAFIRFLDNFRRQGKGTFTVMTPRVTYNCGPNFMDTRLSSDSSPVPFGVFAREQQDLNAAVSHARAEVAELEQQLREREAERRSVQGEYDRLKEEARQKEQKRDRKRAESKEKARQAENARSRAAELRRESTDEDQQKEVAGILANEEGRKACDQELQRLETVLAGLRQEEAKLVAEFNESKVAVAAVVKELQVCVWWLAQAVHTVPEAGEGAGGRGR